MIGVAWKKVFSARHDAKRKGGTPSSPPCLPCHQHWKMLIDSSDTFYNLVFSLIESKLHSVPLANAASVPFANSLGMGFVTHALTVAQLGAVDALRASMLQFAERLESSVVQPGFDKFNIILHINHLVCAPESLLYVMVFLVTKR
jgi:hypothetical protein